MKVEGRIFLYISAFAFIMAIVYAVWARLGSTDYTIEPVGFIGLILTGGLCLIIGTFFEFVSRRLEQPRPEDNPQAEVSDGAGEVGFFSPGSYWPITVAGAVALTGFGLALWQWWLIVLAGIFLIIAVCGLVFEYHAGPEAH